MTLIDLKGRPREFRYKQYLIDWERIVSGPQRAVKDFLRPYWGHEIVLEEARIPGVACRLRIDLWNVNRSIVVEVSPRSTHGHFNPHFHRSLAGYRAAIKRDLEKVRFCEINGLTLCEVVDSDFPLTRAGFKASFGVDL